ncbi:MAG: hypothetical protein ACRDP6_07470 [Actinoallomurus sp.]
MRFRSPTSSKETVAIRLKGKLRRADIQTYTQEDSGEGCSFLSGRGAHTRGDCLAFVEENWTDLRPKRLVEAMSHRDQ